MKSKSTSREVIALPAIESLILLIRGQKVILDADLARLYGVATKVLNQAVKRNHDRFPVEFMFQLSAQEALASFRSRSQFVTLKRGENVKYLPYAFTEHGALMAANVLNSPRAVEMSVVIIKTFVRLRQMLASNADLARRLDTLERKYDGRFKIVFAAIRGLMTNLDARRVDKREIGFHTNMIPPPITKPTKKRRAASGAKPASHRS
ncbi:MAG TPA: ORF6N domain-containing protein [Verrucomicrobiae bacterium]|jgi:hypothetical protein